MSASAATRRAARFSSKRSRGGSTSGDAHHTAFALRRIGQTSADIIARQLRKIGQDLLLAHTRRQIVEDIADRDARSPHARLAEADRWVDDNSLAIVHC